MLWGQRGGGGIKIGCTPPPPRLESVPKAGRSKFFCLQQCTSRRDERHCREYLHEKQPITVKTHPNRRFWGPGVVKSHQKAQFFSHADLKMADPYPSGPHRGAELGKLETVPRNPSVVRRPRKKEKSGMGLGSESTHSGSCRPSKFCTPQCQQPRTAASLSRRCQHASHLIIPMTVKFRGYQ